MASRFRPKTNIRSSMTSLRSEGQAAGGAAADPAADRDRRLDDGRGGFVLKARSDEPPVRRRSFSERSSTIKKTFFQVRLWKVKRAVDCARRRSNANPIRVTRSPFNVRSLSLFSQRAGSATQEAAQHRRTGETRHEGHVGVDPLDGEHRLVDVHRVLAIRNDGCVAAHRLERFVRRRGTVRAFSFVQLARRQVQSRQSKMSTRQVEKARRHFWRAAIPYVFEMTLSRCHFSLWPHAKCQRRRSCRPRPVHIIRQWRTTAPTHD